MRALQNKTKAALDSNTKASKSVGYQGRSSLLDERAALVSPTPDPTLTLKDNRGKTFAVDNDMINVLLLMGKQTNRQIVLISVDPNSCKFKIKCIEVSLVPDGINMNSKVYNFSKGFDMFITSNDVTERDIKGDENKIKQFLRGISYKQRGIQKVKDQNL